MATIKKVIRCLNKGDHAIIEVELEHGGVATVYVGGDVKEIFHAGKVKAYVLHPWERPAQSRTAIDKIKLYE